MRRGGERFPPGLRQRNAPPPLRNRMEHEPFLIDLMTLRRSDSISSAESPDRIPGKNP